MAAGRATALALAATGGAVAGVFLLLGTDGGAVDAARQRLSFVFDFLHYYVPNAEYLATRLRAGDVPLWSARQGVGGPFLATLQPAVLYPSSLLHAALPTSRAFVVDAALHLALSAVFAGALARRIGADAAGAALAGALYGLSPALLGHVWIPPILHALAWTPAVWLAIDRCIGRPGPRSAAALGLAVALQLLAGWPYVVALTGLAGAVYGGALLLGRSGRGTVLGALASLGFGVGLAALLAAPQLLPTLELLPRTSRALGTIRGAAPLGYEPGLFLAQLRSGGNVAIPGLPVLLLAWLPLLGADSRRRAIALLGVAAVALAAAFPRELPVYDALRRLPVMGDFRFPFRYGDLTNLALAVLSGVGLTRLGRLVGARAPAARVATEVAAAGLAVLACLLAGRPVPDLPRAAPGPDVDADYERVAGEPPPAGARVYWTGRSDRLGGDDALAAVFDLEPFSLADTARYLTWLASGRALTRYPLAEAPPARSPGAARARPSGPPDLDASDRSGAPFAGSLQLPAGDERAILLDLLSVERVVTERPPDWLDQRMERLTPQGRRPAVFANPGALPRAYRVGAAEATPERIEDALARLASPGFDARRRVLLEPLPEGLAGSDDPPPARAVRVEVREPERIVLSSEGEAPGVVVLTDAWYPGWVARVDGEARPVLRANTLFRAVAVPAGESRIELRYAPASWRRGLAAGALGVLLLAGALSARTREPTSAP